MEKRVSQKYLIDLKNDYRRLNRKINGDNEPRGRYTKLAEKLSHNLPSFLLEKLKKMDKDNIISRMNYYNKFKMFRKEKKLDNEFNTRNKSNIKKRDSSLDNNNNIDNNNINFSIFN